jgi:ABC-type transport system substrate-binding protein
MTDETQDRAKLEALWRDAHDFDPKDPLLGLSRHDWSGPRLERRSVLRMLAASGLLTTGHLTAALSTARPAHAQSGGELRCGWFGVGEFRTFDPAQITQVLLFQITSNVLSGLTHINPELIAEGDLAHDWTVSDDGLEYTFDLRENVTFHNGDPFTADDVLFTYERSKNPEVSVHHRALANVESLEKLGDYRVRFRLKAPQASFLVKTLERTSGRVLTIVNRRALEEMGPTQYALTPVGTGPFRMTEHQLGGAVTLEKFEDYFDPERPKLDRVVITPIIDVEPTAAAIEANDIQLIGGQPLAPELVDRFQQNPDLTVSIIPGPGFQSLWVNPWHEAMRVEDFSKPLGELMEEPGFKARLAIAKGLDRELYIRQAHFGLVAPAYGTVNPAMGFYYDETLADSSNQASDLEAAKRLLAEAGYPDGEGFPPMKLVHTPAYRRECQVIKAILERNLGLTIELDTKDFPVLLDQFQTMQWDLLRVGSGGDFDPDDALVDWMQTDSKFNGRNRDKAEMPFGFFSDPEVDRLIDEQKVTTDLEKRRELVQEANRITSDKVASAFLYHPVDVLVYRNSVTYPPESRITGLVDLDRASIA